MTCGVDGEFLRHEVRWPMGMQMEVEMEMRISDAMPSGAVFETKPLTSSSN